MPQVSRKALVRKTTNSNWRATLIGVDPTDNRVLPYAAGLESPTEVIKRIRSHQDRRDIPVSHIQLFTGTAQGLDTYLIGECLEEHENNCSLRFLRVNQRVRETDVMARGNVVSYGEEPDFFLDMVGPDDIADALAFKTVLSASMFVTDLINNCGMKSMRVYRVSSRAIDRGRAPWFIEIQRAT